jgi:hypothetical protein
VLLGLALLVRASGVLHRGNDDPSLPPPPARAEVALGVVRGSQPSDLDLVRLRDDYGIRAVIAVNAPTVEEQATTRALDLRLLVLHVPDRGAPPATDILAAARFLHSASVGAGADSQGVFIHDTTGQGPVLVVSCMLRLLHGEPLSTVVRQLSRADLGNVTPQQLRALRELDAALRGQPAAPGPYAALRGVTW